MVALEVKAGTPIKVIKRFKPWNDSSNFEDRATTRDTIFYAEDIVVDPAKPATTNKAMRDWALKGWYGFSCWRFKKNRAKPTSEQWYVMLVPIKYVEAN